MEDFEILELENKGGRFQATCCLEENPFYFKKKTGSRDFVVEGYSSEMKGKYEYRIPSQVRYQGKVGSVVEIGRDAFEDCSSLYILVIPQSIERIDYSDFYNCKNLREIWVESDKCEYNGVLPEGVKVYVGEECKKKAKNIKKWECYYTAKVEIPNDVTWLGLNAFEGYCNISQIEIPDSVEIIGGCAFAGCTSLEKIVIPKNVRIVEERAFVGCSKLEEIWVQNEDCIFNFEDSTIPEQTAIYIGIDKRKVR